MLNDQNLAEFLTDLCSEFGVVDTPIIETITAEIQLQIHQRDALDETDINNRALAGAIIDFLEELRKTGPKTSKQCEVNGLRIIQTKAFGRKE